ncbi:bis(5'-nucleosyl)-tetraphosphatase [Mucisphaera sp.]|uniref:bis(5'-nucleosyl)-tetraphosphatase n=1 Tax=Mucisphaera sp. TaxID=2913024 RepID=UPI003D13D482
MDNDHSCGVIPVYQTPNNHARQYLLVQHKAGHWGFPKGHPEKNESELQTATRELHEETGLTAHHLLEDRLFTERYIFRKRSGKVVDKTVTYFIGFVPEPTFAIQEEELQNAAWGDLQTTLDLMSFDEGRKLLLEVDAFLDRETANSPNSPNSA